MSAASKDTYARLLGNLDRDPYSPTYGSFHREYWLDKTSDFPDAVRQFAVQALALVYCHEFPGNPYKGQPKVREWAIAGLDFWAGIQHRDGSFDEFYPYERGWVGPTGFTTFACAEAFRLLQAEVPVPVAERVASALRRAALFVARGQSEKDDLANHHAMACLAVWKTYELLGDSELRSGFERLWQGFLAYHNAEEGWSREYDGADPGYLSAVISFLSKIYQTNPDPEILKVLVQSVEFCSYFVYPDGSYAGSIGSRNTLHFYPHGFEILSPKIPLAAAVAQRMLDSLDKGNLVPPNIMSDRYVVYRVPEFLEAYRDHQPRPEPLPLLPYERECFRKYFSGAGMYAAVEGKYYTVANLAKGGVVKVFDRRAGSVVVNDSGLIGRLADGRTVTSQWIDGAHEYAVGDGGWEVEGHLNAVPTHKLFTPLKGLLFRIGLLAMGWSPRLSHLLKGYIRKALILGQRSVPIRFHRRFSIAGDAVNLTNEVQLEGRVRLERLSIGDEFSVRYVPQSRYFQSHEIAGIGRELSQDELETLNNSRSLVVEWDLFLVIASLGLTPPLILIKTARWQGILRSQLVEFRIWSAYLAYFGSLFIGFLTPGRLGEFVKAVHVSEECGVSPTRAFSSVLADRLFDLYLLLMVGGVALIAVTSETLLSVIVGLMLTLMLTVPVLFILDHGENTWPQKLRPPRVGRLGVALSALISWAIEVRSELRRLDGRRFLVAGALTLLAYMVLFSQGFLLALALGLDVGFVQVSYVMALGGLVTLIPVSISGLGTREAVSVAYLGTHGVSSEAALGFSLLVFLTFYFGGGLMGALAWWVKPAPLAFPWSRARSGHHRELTVLAG